MSGAWWPLIWTGDRIPTSYSRWGRAIAWKTVNRADINIQGKAYTIILNVEGDYEVWGMSHSLTDVLLYRCPDLLTLRCYLLGLENKDEAPLDRD